MSKSQLDDLTRDRRYGVFIELEGRSIAVIHGNHELWSGGGVRRQDSGVTREFLFSALSMLQPATHYKSRSVLRS